MPAASSFPSTRPVSASPISEVRYNVTDDVQFSFGGDNIFDIEPDKLPFAPANCASVPGVILTKGASCVLGPNNSNGQGQTASNGAVEYSPFGTPLESERRILLCPPGL